MSPPRVLSGLMRLHIERDFAPGERAVRRDEDGLWLEGKCAGCGEAVAESERGVVAYRADGGVTTGGLWHGRCRPADAEPDVPDEETTPDE